MLDSLSNYLKLYFNLYQMHTHYFYCMFLSCHLHVWTNVWLVWPNGWVFVYELSGCRFESSCSHYTNLPTFTHFFSIRHHARVHVWWPVSHIFGENLILSVPIIKSYLANLVTPAAIVQTMIESNSWKKDKHSTCKHIFSRARTDISILKKKSK